MRHLKLADGRDRVVRHGHGPERTIQTGIGPVAVSRVKLRDRGAGRRSDSLHLVDLAAVGAAHEEPGCAAAGSVSAWRLDRRLPGGAWGVVGQGRAEPVADGHRQADGRVGAGIRPLAEARPFRPAIRLCLGGRGLFAGPDGGPLRMHAGADWRDAGGRRNSSGFRLGSARARRAGASFSSISSSAAWRLLQNSPLAMGRWAFGRRSMRYGPPRDISAVGFTRARTC